MKQNTSSNKITEVCEFHITYDNNLDLPELIDILTLINKGVNQLNLQNGVNNSSKLGNYHPVVQEVNKGSIDFKLLLSLIAPLAIKGIEFLVDFIKSKLSQSKKRTYDIKYEHYSDKGFTRFEIHVNN
ncbi:MAG: hypothetical protein K2M36_03425 [Clostridia bacterium]|nr:hypothetical protein [Clostridia bacterium]